MNKTECELGKVHFKRINITSTNQLQALAFNSKMVPCKLSFALISQIYSAGAQFDGQSALKLPKL